MDSDHRLLLRCTKPLLQNRNSAVCINFIVENYAKNLIDYISFFTFCNCDRFNETLQKVDSKIKLYCFILHF